MVVLEIMGEKLNKELCESIGGEFSEDITEVGPYKTRKYLRRCTVIIPNKMEKEIVLDEPTDLYVKLGKGGEISTGKWEIKDINVEPVVINLGRTNIARIYGEGKALLHGVEKMKLGVFDENIKVEINI